MVGFVQICEGGCYVVEGNHVFVFFDFKEAIVEEKVQVDEDCKGGGGWGGWVLRRDG